MTDVGFLATISSKFGARLKFAVLLLAVGAWLFPQTLPFAILNSYARAVQYLLGSIVILQLVFFVWAFSAEYKKEKNICSATSFCLKQLLGERLLTLIVAELNLVCAFGRWLGLCSKRESKDQSHLLQFSYTNGNTNSGIVALLILAGVIEFSLTHLVLEHYRVSRTIQLSMLIIGLWSLVWIIGESQVLQESLHVIDIKRVIIKLGIRSQAQIPMDLITHISVISTFLEGQKKAHDAVVVSPGEDPNVVILLREPVDFTLIFGRKKSAKSIYLYVDDPPKFVLELSRKLE